MSGVREFIPAPLYKGIPKKELRKIFLSVIYNESSCITAKGNIFGNEGKLARQNQTESWLRNSKLEGYKSLQSPASLHLKSLSYDFKISDRPILSLSTNISTNLESEKVPSKKQKANEKQLPFLNEYMQKLKHDLIMSRKLVGDKSGKHKTLPRIKNTQKKREISDKQPDTDPAVKSVEQLEHSRSFSDKISMKKSNDSKKDRKKFSVNSKRENKILRQYIKFSVKRKSMEKLKARVPTKNRRKKNDFKKKNKFPSLLLYSADNAPQTKKLELHETVGKEKKEQHKGKLIIKSPNKIVQEVCDIRNDIPVLFTRVRKVVQGVNEIGPNLNQLQNPSHSDVIQRTKSKPKSLRVSKSDLPTLFNKVRKVVQGVNEVSLSSKTNSMGEPKSEDLILYKKIPENELRLYQNNPQKNKGEKVSKDNGKNLISKGMENEILANVNRLPLPGKINQSSLPHKIKNKKNNRSEIVIQRIPKKIAESSSSVPYIMQKNTVSNYDSKNYEQLSSSLRNLWKKLLDFKIDAEFKPIKTERMNTSHNTIMDIRKKWPQTKEIKINFQIRNTRKSKINFKGEDAFEWGKPNFKSSEMLKKMNKEPSKISFLMINKANISVNKNEENKENTIKKLSNFPVENKKTTMLQDSSKLYGEFFNRERYPGWVHKKYSHEKYSQGGNSLTFQKNSLVTPKITTRNNQVKTSRDNFYYSQPQLLPKASNKQNLLGDNTLTFQKNSQLTPKRTTGNDHQVKTSRDNFYYSQPQLLPKASNKQDLLGDNTLNFQKNSQLTPKRTTGNDPQVKTSRDNFYYSQPKLLPKASNKQDLMGNNTLNFQKNSQLTPKRTTGNVPQVKTSRDNFYYSQPKLLPKASNKQDLLGDSTLTFQKNSQLTPKKTTGNDHQVKTSRDNFYYSQPKLLPKASNKQDLLGDNTLNFQNNSQVTPKRTTRNDQVKSKRDYVYYPQPNEEIKNDFGLKLRPDVSFTGPYRHSDSKINLILHDKPSYMKNDVLAKTDRENRWNNRNTVVNNTKDHKVENKSIVHSREKNNSSQVKKDDKNSQKINFYSIIDTFLASETNPEKKATYKGVKNIQPYHTNVQTANKNTHTYIKGDNKSQKNEKLTPTIIKNQKLSSKNDKMGIVVKPVHIFERITRIKPSACEQISLLEDKGIFCNRSQHETLLRKSLNELLAGNALWGKRSVNSLGFFHNRQIPSIKGESRSKSFHSNKNATVTSSHAKKPQEVEPILKINQWQDKTGNKTLKPNNSEINTIKFNWSNISLRKYNNTGESEVPLVLIRNLKEPGLNDKFANKDNNNNPVLPLDPGREREAIKLNKSASYDTGKKYFWKSTTKKDIKLPLSYVNTNKSLPSSGMFSRRYSDKSNPSLYKNNNPGVHYGVNEGNFSMVLRSLRDKNKTNSAYFNHESNDLKMPINYTLIKKTAALSKKSNSYKRKNETVYKVRNKNPYLNKFLKRKFVLDRSRVQFYKGGKSILHAEIFKNKNSLPNKSVGEQSDLKLEPSEKKRKDSSFINELKKNVKIKDEKLAIRNDQTLHHTTNKNKLPSGSDSKFRSTEGTRRDSIEGPCRSYLSKDEPKFSLANNNMQTCNQLRKFPLLQMKLPNIIYTWEALQKVRKGKSDDYWSSREMSVYDSFLKYKQNEKKM